MGVDLVQPVAIRNAEFCVLCNTCMWDWAKSGCHTELAYVRTGHTNCLYKAVKDSFECPNDVADKAFITFNRDLALALISCVCWGKVQPRSIVTPSMFFVANRNGLTHQCNCGFQPVFHVMWCNYCKGGLWAFCWHTVGGEPFLQPPEIVLQLNCGLLMVSCVSDVCSWYRTGHRVNKGRDTRQYLFLQYTN